MEGTSLISSVMALAEKHLKNFKISNGQVVAEYCPFCGGNGKDKETFAVGLSNGAWQCLRGSCQEKGSFKQLCEHFGERPPEVFGLPSTISTRKKYQLPDVELLPATEEIISYFATRRISPETVRAFNIAADKEGNIVFPFRRRQDEDVVYVKFRKPYTEKPVDGKKPKKEWQAPGCEPILFNMDQVTNNKPLVITEGQIDAMAIYEAGYKNVVSVPCGCNNMDWIENCWEWLEGFNQIILFGDSDQCGQEMINICAKRLGEERCMIPSQYPELIIEKDGEKINTGRICKDANEILYAYGAAYLLEMVKACQPAPIKGVINLADVPFVDPTTVPRIFTRIPTLDDMIAGLGEGTVTVLTGKRGEG